MKLNKLNATCSFDDINKHYNKIEVLIEELEILTESVNHVEKVKDSLTLGIDSEEFIAQSVQAITLGVIEDISEEGLGEKLKNLKDKIVEIIKKIIASLNEWSAVALNRTKPLMIKIEKELTQGKLKDANQIDEQHFGAILYVGYDWEQTKKIASGMKTIVPPFISDYNTVLKNDQKELLKLLGYKIEDNTILKDKSVEDIKQSNLGDDEFTPNNFKNVTREILNALNAVEPRMGKIKSEAKKTLNASSSANNSEAITAVKDATVNMNKARNLVKIQLSESLKIASGILTIIGKIKLRGES